MKRQHALIFLIVWPLVGAFILRLSEANAFASVIVFFGIPGLLCTLFLHKRTIKKISFFSLVIPIPAIIIIDGIAELTGQWNIPFSILPRIFSFVSIEVIAWAVFHTYFVLAFYKMYLDRARDRIIIQHRLSRFVAFIGILFAVFVVLFILGSGGLQIPYFYAIFGTTCILLPVVVILIRHPSLLGRYAILASYFFYLTLVYELLAIRMGWWLFPGNQYIGWISLFNITFPFEEFLFWLMLFPMAIVSVYEIFDDNSR